MMLVVFVLRHSHHFSFVFPDPSLTPENLSTVLEHMRDDLWYLFSEYVNVPHSEREKIRRQYSSHRERKQAVIPHIISTHPALSWELVAYALYEMTNDYGGDESCHRALHHLQQLFPSGNIPTCPYSIGD